MSQSAVKQMVGCVSFSFSWITNTSSCVCLFYRDYRLIVLWIDSVCLQHSPCAILLEPFRMDSCHSVNHSLGDAGTENITIIFEFQVNQEMRVYRSIDLWKSLAERNDHWNEIDPVTKIELTVNCCHVVVDCCCVGGAVGGWDCDVIGGGEFTGVDGWAVTGVRVGDGAIIWSVPYFNELHTEHKMMSVVC